MFPAIQKMDHADQSCAKNLQKSPIIRHLRGFCDWNAGDVGFVGCNGAERMVGWPGPVLDPFFHKIASGLRFSSKVPRVTPTRFVAFSVRQTSSPAILPSIN